MRKLLSISVALAVGVVSTYAQGLISISAVSPEVYISGGASNGPATGPAGTYLYEMLDMTEGAWNALSGAQTNAADNVFVNPLALSLWTDSGVSGMNYNSLRPGGIMALGGAAGTTVANWAPPTGFAYDTGGIDYYTIVGWSANAAGSWKALTNGIISGGGLPAGPSYFYGQTQVAYNYAGGGLDGLPVVNLFGGPSSTGLADSGLPATDALTLYSFPEPSTLALVGLGGVSILSKIILFGQHALWRRWVSIRC
jgi:hypothetical protein